MIITFQIQIDPLEFGEDNDWKPNTKKKFNIEQLKQMKKQMTDFIDEIYTTSGREYIRADMYVDGEKFEL